MTAVEIAQVGRRHNLLPLPNLREERAPVGFEEFGKPDRPFSPDLLNQIVCSCKHSILVVFCNLRKVLPEGVGVVPTRGCWQPVS